MFDAPLRLLREGQLIESPMLADLSLAALRRVMAYSRGESATDDRALAHAVLEWAAATPSLPWSGHRLDVERFSSRQKREIEMRGVVGRLGLPQGPGDLAGLLAAGSLLGLGKGTTIGMGALRIEPSRV